MAKKKRKPKVDDLRPEMPVHSQSSAKSRRNYIFSMLKSVALKPSMGSAGKKALSELKGLTDEFDLDKVPQCISIMKKHETNVDIQALGCASVASLAIQESKALIQFGIVDAVINAMENNPKAKRVQASASLLVWNIAVIDEHKKLLASNGVDDLLLAALRTHEKEQPVQHMAIGAIKILANDNDIKMTLAEKGAIGLIVKAMETFTNSSESKVELLQMTETCIGALQNFAFGKSCVQELMSLGVGRSIIGAMNKYPEDSELQTSACGALWNLGIPRENKLELAEMGATVSIVRAIQTFTDDENVILNCVGALKNLLILPDALTVFKVSNDRQTVIQNLERCCVVHGDHNDINRIGLELLDILYGAGEALDDDDEMVPETIDD